MFYKANKGFMDSNVKIKLRLMCMQKYDGNEQKYESQKLVRDFWLHKRWSLL